MPRPFPPVALRLPGRHCDSGRASDRLLRVFVSNCRQMGRRGFRKRSRRFAMRAVARTRAEDRRTPLPVGIVRRRLWVSERRRRLHGPPRSEVAHVGLLVRRLTPDVAVEAECPVVRCAIPLRPLLPLLDGNDCAGRTAHGWNACSVSDGRNGRKSVSTAAAATRRCMACDSGRFRVRIFREFTSNWRRSINRTPTLNTQKASAVRSRQADGRS
jgi:hypothetical protein